MNGDISGQTEQFDSIHLISKLLIIQYTIEKSGQWTWTEPDPDTMSQTEYQNNNSESVSQSGRVG